MDWIGNAYARWLPNTLDAALFESTSSPKPRDERLTGALSEVSMIYRTRAEIGATGTWRGVPPVPNRELEAHAWREAMAPARWGSLHGRARP